MSFEDSTHGWILLYGNEPRGFYLGYKTEGGGHTWHYCGSGARGPISFVNAQTGWSFGGDDLRGPAPGIYQTDDGGETWRILELHPLGPEERMDFSSNPVVVGPGHYSVIVLRTSVSTREYLMESFDSGRSWRNS